MAKQTPSVLGTTLKKTQAPATNAPAPTETFWLVERTSRVPNGVAHFTLPAGKVISSVGYNVAYLQQIGVPLKQVDKGGSPVRAQVVGAPAAPLPTPVADPAPAAPAATSDPQ